MPDQSDKPWFQFEEVIANLQKGFHPGARIGRHERIIGQNSLTLREIDICIRQTVGLQELLIVVDCKKRSRKVDVAGMDAFAGLKEDVAAHAGIIVSEKGFSKAALAVAKRKNIQALTFRDTKNQAWAKHLLIPIGLELRVLMPTRVTFEPRGEAEVDVVPSDVALWDRPSGKQVTLRQLLERQWYEVAEPESGSWTVSLNASEDDGTPKGVFRFSYIVEKRKYVSKMGLDFIGFEDKQNKIAHLNSLECPEIHLNDVEKNWTRLDPNSQFASPLLVVVMKTILNAKIEGSSVVPNFPDAALKLSFHASADKPFRLQIGG